MVYSRYYTFSTGLMLFPGTYNTMSVSQLLHNIPYVTLVARQSPTSGGPHRLMTSNPIVTRPLGIVALWLRNQWI
jgi:hypothetical protein